MKQFEFLKTIHMREPARKEYYGRLNMVLYVTPRDVAC